MSGNEILRLVVKLIGLAIVVASLIDAATIIPMVAMQYKNLGMETSTMTYLVSFLTPFLIGLFLWFFPAPVSNTVIKNDLNNEDRNEFLLGLENIGIRILGLYLLYHGISHLVSNLLAVSQMTNAFGDSYDFAGKEKFKILFGVVTLEIIMSIFLIVGANAISKFLHKIKFAS